MAALEKQRGASAVAEAAPTTLAATPIARMLWLLLAYLALALGLIGVVLPGLPTTPFILLAAFAATRGSLRLRRWLHDHRLFGPMVTNWQREGAVSRRAKWTATLTMILCAAVMFLSASQWWMAATGTAVMTLVAVWLWTRPLPSKSSPSSQEQFQ